MNTETKTLGQVAFEAHRDYLEGSRPWSDVREPERAVWEATATAVRAAIAGNGLGDWEMYARDPIGNAILRYKPADALYRAVPVEESGEQS